MDVGVRELRDRLSHHLASVKEGHSITVTDHGRPVARIVPCRSARPSWRRLIAERQGHAGVAIARALGDHPISTAGTVSDLVDEQRG